MGILILNADLQLVRFVPVPQDGLWGPWSAFTSCSKNCGGGIQTRTRLCNNPPPDFGGRDCNGPAFETANCNDRPCSLLIFNF